MPITLRRMHEGDVEAVMRIERVAHSHPWSVELLRRELDHDWSTVLVAEDSDSAELCGYIIFWLVHDEIHVLNVATDPSRRRCGIGRQLMKAAEEQGLGKGAVMTTLEVRRSNEPAIRLYQSLDFRQVGVRPRYYADNHEDAIVMLKDLKRP